MPSLESSPRFGYCQDMNRGDDDLPTYQDVFTDGELPRQPRIMKDGTSVRWPPGWTMEDAARWRRENNLESPAARRKRIRLVVPPGAPDPEPEQGPAAVDMTKWRDN